MIKKFCVIHICFAVIITSGIIGGCDKKEAVQLKDDDTTGTKTTIKEPVMTDVSTRVKIETSKGDIIIELDEKRPRLRRKIS